METYNYDAAAAVPEGDAEMTPETDTAAAGIGPPFFTTHT